MVDALTGTSTAATLSIATADVQIAAVTNSIANQINVAAPTSSVFGSSAVAAPPITGTQPSNAASQVFQALQAPPAVGTSGTAPSVSHSPAYDISFQPSSPSADSQGLVARPNVNPVQQTVEIASAANAFAANAQSLQTTNQINHRILDVTT
jgi:flagellar basal-body rod protein FlgC